MDRRKNIAVVTVALLALAGPRAHALQLVDLSPRGEVARVRQVVATFDEPAVDFGDPSAPAPFTVRRDDAQAGKGTPRWTGAKRWVFDFAADLPPGVRCTVERLAGFRSAAGAALKAPSDRVSTLADRPCARSGRRAGRSTSGRPSCSNSAARPRPRACVSTSGARPTARANASPSRSSRTPNATRCSRRSGGTRPRVPNRRASPRCAATAR